MCKIIKAEMVGKDLHIQCEEMAVPDVYGTDSKFTVKEAVKAFTSRHKANEADKKRTAKQVPDIVGTEI